jgi:hypothetical protein
MVLNQVQAYSKPNFKHLFAGGYVFYDLALISPFFFLFSLNFGINLTWKMVIFPT